MPIFIYVNYYVATTARILIINVIISYDQNHIVLSKVKNVKTHRVCDICISAKDISFT